MYPVTNTPPSEVIATSVATELNVSPSNPLEDLDHSLTVGKFPIAVKSSLKLAIRADYLLTGPGS